MIRGMQRRHFLTAGIGAAWAATGCHPADPHAHIAGGFVGGEPARGHWLRDTLRAGQPLPAPTATFKTRVLIAGGGVGTLQHLAAGITEGHATGVLAASIFHFGQHTIAEAKAAMTAAGVRVRPA